MGKMKHNARKIIEHTYGTHIYMKLELDGVEYEVTRYCGTDYSWNHYQTTADGTDKRDAVIAAFKELY
jgi:hypothetical protein